MTDKRKPLPILAHAKATLETRSLWQGRPSPETQAAYLPAMTWTDWELLQELHKARESSQLCRDEGCTHHGTPHVCVNDVQPFPSCTEQYESLATAGIKPAMNWQAVAADLQDQIKDWETKCLQLETQRDKALTAASDNARALQRSEDEIRQLSKSLQHYRNAYFADQGKEGNSDGQK